MYEQMMKTINERMTAIFIELITYYKQLRSVKPSMKSKSWLISYVIDGLLG